MKNGCINIWDMDDNHLVNTIRLFTKGFLSNPDGFTQKYVYALGKAMQPYFAEVAARGIDCPTVKLFTQQAKEKLKNFDKFEATAFAKSSAKPVVKKRSFTMNGEIAQMMVENYDDDCYHGDNYHDYYDRW